MRLYDFQLNYNIILLQEEQEQHKKQEQILSEGNMNTILTSHIYLHKVVVQVVSYDFNNHNLQRHLTKRNDRFKY